jgi:hypothetical protein
MNMPLALLNRRRRIGGFSPSALFALAEPGVWFDPSDVANLNWRRNLLTWTEQFDNAAWTATRATVSANSDTAPDGTTTADKLVANTDNNTHFVNRTLNLVGAHTFSAFFKAAGYSRVRFSDGSGTAKSLDVDIQNGTIVLTGSSVSNGSVQFVGNGWFRVSFTITDLLGFTVFIDNGSGLSFAGNGTSGILVWGAQLELGSVATDYQRITDVNTEVIERFPTATLYQDTAGTTPVTTTGQSVGLMLDKSKGLVLGSERLTNGDFASGSTGWLVQNADATHIATFSGGTLRYQSDTTSPQLVVEQLGSLVVGRTYLVEVTTSSWTSGSIKSDSFGGNTILSTGVGTVRVRVAASSTSFQITRNTTNVDATIDNISVKELPGNHAVQATSANRPIYGIHPFGGRRNLLVRTEEFENASWGKQAGATVTANVIAAPDGTTTADRITNVSGVSSVAIFQQATPTAASHTFSVYLRADTTSTTLLGIFAGSGFLTVTPTILSGPGSVSGTTIFTVSGLSTTEWTRVGYTFTGTAVLSSLYIYPETAASGTGKSIYAWGAQLETGSTATAYQRVTDQYNVTEAGVPSVSYLFFDGVNDSLATPSINFATATSDGQARRNLLTFPTAFDDAFWSKGGATVSANTSVAPDGTSTADKLAEDTSTGVHRVLDQNGTSVSSGATYTWSVYAKAAERTVVRVSNNSLAGATFDLNNNASASDLSSGITATASSVGNGWFRLVISAAAATGTERIVVQPVVGGNTSYTGTAGSGILVWGAQLETGTTASAFQNIGTDKMNVFAGVRKLSDASVQSFVELSAAGDSNNGAFYLRTPESASKYGFLSRGTGNASAVYNGSLHSAPTTNVLTTLGDISGDNATLRINGVQSATSSANQGTGTYGNYPLFIGGRNSASLFFSGHLYSLIVRGAQSNTGQISSTETWVAGKTGITI